MYREDFSKWILEEIEKRLWSQADLATAANISPSLLSKIIRGERNPGPDTCAAIAKAFGISPTEVFRKAGLLPEVDAGMSDPQLQLAYDILDSLDPEQRKQAIAYMRFLKQSKERPAPISNLDTAYEH